MNATHQTTHTPGPWETVNNYGGLGGLWIFSEGKPFQPKTTVFDSTAADAFPLSTADECLIRAAPDLLVACERAIAALAANGDPNCEAVKECRAAIAKATT